MRANVKNSLNYIRKITDFVPDVALILGSGLGGFTKTMEEVVCSIPYNRIPGFPVSTVSGHAGKYVMGYIKGVPVICMEGRVHYYEGYTPEEVVLPVRVMRALGAKVLFITNAAGGISEDLQPGSLVILRDHVSLFVPNPLRGANDPSEGERFPDMTEVYDRFLRKIIEQNAARSGMPISEGVYCQLSGPSYETPYEIKILAQMGVDVVGMSTVMEAIAANHMGMNVCGLSLVTNMAAGINTERLSHNDVKMAAKDAEKQFAALITASIGDVKQYLETLDK
ncbi:MAG: purine-nucleoside phosphorylase [Lachnospiraceae bacterium]|nr:purine-nucleoside phosphorylase [Lachnospiraceae bacterium]